jgi:phosphate transport system substrate-binding protein
LALYIAQRLKLTNRRIHSVNSSRKRSIALSGIVALSLLAAACGSDDDTKSTSAPTTVATPTTAASTATSAADTATTEGSTETTAASSDTTEAASTDTTPAVDYAALQGSLIASGATFPKGFYDEAIANFAELAPDLTIEYGGGGSGKGRSDLQEKVVDFAGTDGVVKSEDMSKFTGGEFVYVPTVLAPITLSYNLPSVDTLQLSPATISGIFQLKITKWSDPLIAADNPDATLPDTDIVVARRADGSGTTENFSKFLNAAVGTDAGGDWALGSGSELEWPDGTQAGDGNSGVAQIITSTEGAIGYVDLSDAKANDLTFAAVKNKAGNFVEPTLEATSEAASNVEVKDDLTFFTGWADGDGSYPIAAQTWIIAYTEQADPAKAEAIRGFLTYLLTEGQDLAPTIDYAPLPDDLRTKALANIAKIGA